MLWQKHIILEDIQDVWDEYDRSKGIKTQTEFENEIEQDNLDRQNARDIEKMNALAQ